MELAGSGAPRLFLPRPSRWEPVRRRGVVAKPAMPTLAYAPPRRRRRSCGRGCARTPARVGPTAAAAALFSVRRGACRTRRRRPRGRTVTGDKRNLGYPTTTGQAIVFASHSSRAILRQKRRQPTRSFGFRHDRPQVCVRRRSSKRRDPSTRPSVAHTSAACHYRSCWIAFFVHSGRCGLPCRWWPQHCPRRIGNLARKAQCCSAFPTSRKGAADSRLACLRSP